MKNIQLLLLLAMLFIVSGVSIAHDDKEKYSKIGKAIETKLKKTVDSKNTQKDVLTYAEKLLSDYYKIKKVGRFWVKEVDE